nr:uncharacterized protein LOC115262718 [Aedes albopictus]
MDESGAYKKSGNLGGTRRGDAYQVHVLMMLGERAVSNHQRYADFKLATEMEAAGKFDDAVLVWKSPDGSRSWLFVQVKHKKQDAVLTEMDLFPVTNYVRAKGDFSLHKYLISFWENIHCSEFDGGKQFVMFTNCGVADSVQDWFTDGADEVEPILKSKTSGERFLKVQAKEEHYEQMLKYANKDFLLLYETLRSIIIDEKNDFGLDIVCKYRAALNSKILIVDGKKVKFAPRFIERNKLDLLERILRNKLFPEDATLEQLTSYGVSNEHLLKILTSESKCCNALPPMIVRSEVQDFFDSTIFAVKQPHNDAMKTVILNELRLHQTSPTQRCGGGDYYALLAYSSLQYKIHSRLDSPTGMSLCREDLESELQNVQRSISSSRLSLQTNIFRGEMLNLRMEVSSPEFRISKYPAALVSSTCDGLLTCLKMFQILPETSLRYFLLRDLQHHSIVDELCDALKEPSANFHLLLKDDCSKFEYASDILNALPSTGSIKLVLITDCKQSAERFFTDRDFNLYVDDDTTFGQLTESSQNILKHKTVLFQGIEVNVGELADDAVVADVFKNETLEKLIKDKSVSIGPNLPDVGVKYYISRTITSSESEESDTSGSNSNETVDEDSNETACYNEHQFLEDLPEVLGERKVFVLSSTPGMGKTTLWKKLALMAKSRFRTKWVFYLKLQDLSMVTSGKINAIDFLANHFELPQLDRLLLEDCLSITKTDSVYIFVDGFDELPHNAMEPVTNLIRYLQQTVQIFVNTRTRLQLELEEAFDVKSFFLNPISKSEQTDLFKNICGFVNGARVKTRPLVKFVNRLMDRVHSKPMQIASNFVGVPLMVNMLAEVYKPDVERYSETKDPRILNEIEVDALDIMELFEKFIYSSFRRQNIEKQKLEADNRHTDLMLNQNNYFYAGFIKLHNFLGLMSLVTSEKMHLVIRDKLELQILQQQIPLLDSPIVSKVPNFIHGSIAEFFAAKCLFKYLNRMGDGHIKAIFMKNADKDTFDIYFRMLRDYPTVRKFFFLTVRQQSFNLKRLEMLLRCMRPYPLLWACEENFEELAIHLIEQDPNVVHSTNHKYKETALHFAAAQGHVRLCTLLIENKVNVDAQNIHNQTALHKAAYNGCDEVVALLLTKKANVSSLDNLQQTPLFRAALAGHSSTVQLLMKKYANLNEMNKRGWTALHIAAINNHIDVVRVLLSKKVKVKLGRAKKLTGFLQMLLSRGHLDMVKLLVTYEVESLKRNTDVNQTLFWAIRRNHLEIVQTIHRAGAPIIVIDDRSELFTYELALNAKSFRIAEFILSVQSTVVPKFALHMAAEAGSIGCVSILLNRFEAEVNATNQKGVSPLELALKNGHAAVVRMLLEKSAKISKYMLIYAICVNKEGSFECTKELLLHGADPMEIHEPTGRSALHYAVLVDHYECTKLLLQRGASCAIKDKHGRTPLHYMALNRCRYALKAFLEVTNGFRDLENVRELIRVKDDILGESVIDSARACFVPLYRTLKAVEPIEGIFVGEYLI